ncbi:ABC transporter ATP-binding protein [Pararobbsia silviterrae]|uniref:ABC transporter ATP-binding protein n=1 Tax=Pararobbsia silviterrae TaxID=1792498 RepID=A0A494XZP0_9BURK|nr:ABC transporter ATP-binding protein [Pararobbsia silviterrae]RKP53581.1 ABC transporter ATP-binding protein [Pararobbsia silviterrae]
MSAHRLEARDIHVRYRRDDRHRAEREALASPAHTVLSGVDLRVADAQIVSLIGPSGCGKSTLLRVLAGLQRPDSGTVSLAGRPFDTPQADIAVAFQDPCLLPWLDVARNVGFGLDFGNRTRLSRAQKRARVEAVLEHVGLPHAKQASPSQLSGGMAQRVALARCLAREPRVLLLDEPFGALDESTRDDMQQLLMQIVRRARTATVLVTHDLDEALRVSDQIVLLGMHGREAGRWTLDASTPRDPADPGYTVLHDTIRRALHGARHAPARAVDHAPPRPILATEDRIGI